MGGYGNDDFWTVCVWLICSVSDAFFPCVEVQLDSWTVGRLDGWTVLKNNDKSLQFVIFLSYYANDIFDLF